jgi:threonine/homoserine/homoserine lactone efflux protein
MTDSVFIYLLIALAATTIGAVPLGLVNLSVVNSALKNDTRGALQIAHGASVVEVLFALSSLLAGAQLLPFLDGNPVVRYFVFAVLLILGLFFLFKKNKEKIPIEKGESYGYLKGAFLNIISIQVLLFWLLTATLLSANQLLPVTTSEVLIFLVGVWLTKMAVLKGFALLAQKVVSRSPEISAHINQIIGVVLISGAIIQLIKI